MQNVVLIVHLILAVSLIAIVLLQRSEGGGLGIGGGGGGGGAGGRPKPSPLSRVTWALALGFLATSMTLTVLSATNGSGRSVLDGTTTSTTEEPSSNNGGLGEDLLPPTPEDEPLLPPKAE